MKKLIAILLLLFMALPAYAEITAQPMEISDSEPLKIDALTDARNEVWNAYCNAMLKDSTLIKEINDSAMTFGEATMRYNVKVIGDRPENGYPLYIAMHGGGADEDPEGNDDQWAQMQEYYSAALECGVYVAVRGVRDTWDTHFNPESYPLYDRLIRYMTLSDEVDPNRVYLEGFSAGGDGVYAIAARMPDRFAAVNMSSGHPNGISMVNLYNLPIQLQAGEFDDMYDRNTVTAEYGLKLDALQAENGGYEHRTLIHYDCGHNYDDFQPNPIPVMSNVAAWLEAGDRTHEDVDSFPPDYMDQYTRDALPSTLIWDLSTRADSRQTETFYYMTAPYTTNQGAVRVVNEGDNYFSIDTQDVNGDFGMLLNERMVDFSRPVTFNVDGKETTLTLMPDKTLLTRTTQDRGDPEYQFEAGVTFHVSF
ncbi:MAG: hypothetical protein IKE17_13150 [Clostridia bacterium]|nr:hypothetical protein [Clostridia bacterium]